jgi:hypothetical protein
MSYRLDRRHLDGFTYGFGGLRDYAAYYRSGRSDHQKPDHRFDSH